MQPPCEGIERVDKYLGRFYSLAIKNYFGSYNCGTEFRSVEALNYLI